MLRVGLRCSFGLVLGLGAVACGGDAESAPEVTLDAGGGFEAGVVTGDSSVPGLGGGDASVPSPASDSGSPAAPDAKAGAEAGSSSDASSGDAAKPDATTDGSAGSDASADAGTDAGGDKPRPKPKCVKKDSQVMVIGDSYINWISHQFPAQLKTATKQNWRMLAVGGHAMGSGGIGSIPGQFEQSIAADPDAHTVLMDGGGNDVLVPDLFLDNLLFAECKEATSATNPKCHEIIKRALDAADKLMDSAAAKGIRDVVYFFYPHVPEGRLIGGPKPNVILDYTLPMVESFCNGAEARTGGKLRCHFINMIPVFEGHVPDIPGSTVMPGSEADWFNGDIHPNEKGSQAMVNKIWEVMQAKCIGQKDKDCCEP